MGVNFAGSDYIDGGDNLDLDRTEPAAISLWYKDDAASPGSFVALLTKMENTGDLRGWGVLRASDDDLMFRLRNSSGNSLQVSWSRVVGAWTHLLIVYDGSETAGGVSVWTDASAESPTVNSNDLSSTTLTTANFTLAGRDGGNINWTGSLAEAAIWTGAGVQNMGQAEAARLAAGLRPTHLTPFAGQLVLFDDLAAGVNQALWHRGPTLTNNGATFNVDDHPRVVVPPWPYAQAV